MVDCKAQAFTLEGIAASLLLLVTTYAVFQSSVVISPSWGELEDVQLKLLGYDLLRSIDINDDSKISLAGMLSSINKTTNCSDGTCTVNQEFRDNFSSLLRTLDLNCRLEVLWVNETKKSLENTTLKPFDSDPLTDSVSVDRIVIIQGDSSNPFCSSGKCAVEVRLIIWKV
ncbi:DUF7288 family protein [Archaeoglobus sp.]